MNELTNIHAIDPTALRQGEYLVSLLTEARRCGLLPQAENDGEIVRRLLAEYEVEEDVLRADVAEFLGKLRALGILA